MGLNLGTEASTAPLGGREWFPVLPVVAVDEFGPVEASPNAAVTTVMNWQAHEPIEYDGRSYGQKDVEFRKFLDLPERISLPCEVAIAGDAPRGELRGSRVVVARRA